MGQDEGLSLVARRHLHLVECACSRADFARAPRAPVPCRAACFTRGVPESAPAPSRAPRGHAAPQPSPDERVARALAAGAPWATQEVEQWELPVSKDKSKLPVVGRDAVIVCFLESFNFQASGVSPGEREGWERRAPDRCLPRAAAARARSLR